MPPPQQRLALGLRGFICRSCSSKLRITQQARIQNAYRAITNDQGPTNPPRPKTIKREPRFEVHIFDQDPDGTRREVTDEREPGAEEALAHIEEEIKSLEGMGLGEDDIATKDEEDILFEEALFDNFEEEASADEEAPPDLEFHTQQLEELIKRDRAPMKERTGAEFSQYGEASLSRFHFSVAAFPPEYHDNIWKLQTALAQFSEHQSWFRSKQKGKRGSQPPVTGPSIPESTKRTMLVKFYLLARKGLMTAPKEVPSIVWKTLWEVFDVEEAQNPDRLINIRRIGEDMWEADIPMTEAQVLLYIEAMFIDGKRKSALEKWESIGRSTEEPKGLKYWELGLRMWCEMDRIDQAVLAADELFKLVDLQKITDENRYLYRALLPLVQASLKSTGDHSVQRAWALYVRIKINLGSQMTMADYDAIISFFMDANQPELALAVFKDMMLTNDTGSAKHGSPALYKASGIEGDFAGITIDPSELAFRDWRGVSRLPAKFNNKYFLGSWVKKLIGGGRLEDAYKVLELMQDHGIRPSTMHVNGLIGAWFREGSVECWNRADELAWKLIQARLDFVKATTTRRRLAHPLRTTVSDAPEVPLTHLLPPTEEKGFVRPKLGAERLRQTDVLPLASVETFTLLLREYRSRNKERPLSRLFDILRQARILPNTTYLNQLLLLDLRKHHRTWAFDTYRDMTAGPNAVTPNMQTFAILWDHMKRAVDPSIRLKALARSRSLAHGSPRWLFSEMMKYKTPLIRSKVRLTQELYDLIILVFSLSNDQAGTAIAMRALQQAFDVFPSEETGRTIVLQLSRQGLHNEMGGKPRYMRLKRNRHRIGSVVGILQKFKDERIKALEDRGVVLDNLGPREQLEETLTSFSDLLRFAAQMRYRAEGRTTTVNETCKIAAAQMGVPYCIPWAPQIETQIEDVD